MHVVVVDDHPLAREGIKSILAQHQLIDNIMEASNIKEALDIIKKEKPDIVLVDLKLGDEDGLVIMKKGKEISQSSKFLILTSFMSEEDFFRAEKLEPDGYLLKEAATEDIIYALGVISRGKKYYDPGIIDKYRSFKENENVIKQLTEREKEIINELGKGLSNEKIARQLYISENTVKKHISSILTKMNLQHRTQAALLINKIGLFEENSKRIIK